MQFQDDLLSYQLTSKTINIPKLTMYNNKLDGEDNCTGETSPMMTRPAQYLGCNILPRAQIGRAHV